MVTILSRSRWTSTSARGSAINWSRVRGIVAHYPAMGASVGVLTMAQEAARLRGWRSYHVNSLGWMDIGYSYAIGQSGRVYSLRGDRVGGHTYGHNSTTLGVLFIVGDNEALTSAAKASFRALRTTLRKRGASSGIWGHTEMSGNSTRCPGPYIMGSIRDGSLKGGAPATSTPVKNPARPWTTSPRVNDYTTAEVKAIQRELAGEGYDLGSYGVDGSYGDSTGKAVQALQADLGLTADGIYGPSTEAEMASIKAIVTENQRRINEVRDIAAENQRRIDATRNELDWVRRVGEANQKRIDKVDAKVGPIKRNGKMVSVRQELADAKTIATANAGGIGAIQKALDEADVDATEAKVPEKIEG